MFSSGKDIWTKDKQAQARSLTSQVCHPAMQKLYTAEYKQICNQHYATLRLKAEVEGNCTGLAAAWRPVRT